MGFHKEVLVEFGIFESPNKVVARISYWGSLIVGAVPYLYFVIVRVLTVIFGLFVESKIPEPKLIMPNFGYLQIRGSEI